MADIIYATPQNQGGFKLGDLLPIVGIGILAFGAYWLLSQFTGSGTPSQGSNTGPSLGSVTGNGGGYGNAGGDAVVQAQGSSLQRMISTVQNAIKPVTVLTGLPVGSTYVSSANPAALQNTQWVDASQRGGFAGQAQISYEGTPSATVVRETVANLANSQASQGINNAWWQTPTITQTTSPGGVNSGGSYQSNIPVGTKHCPCTAALKQAGVCGPNDDWYYC